MAGNLNTKCKGLHDENLETPKKETEEDKRPSYAQNSQLLEAASTFMVYVCANTLS